MFPFMLSSLTDGESNTDENLWNKWMSPEALQKKQQSANIFNRINIQAGLKAP